MGKLFYGTLVLLLLTGQKNVLRVGLENITTINSSMQVKIAVNPIIKSVIFLLSIQHISCPCSLIALLSAMSLPHPTL